MLNADVTFSLSLVGGCATQRDLLFTDGNGDAIDFSGYASASEVRDVPGGTVLGSLEVALNTPQTGYIQITCPASLSALLAANYTAAVYGVTVTYLNEDPERIAHGTLTTVTVAAP